MKGFVAVLSLVILSISAQFEAVASPQVEDALLSSYGDEDFISLATGQRQLISKAPAVATVITAADIQAVGAVDLDDVLEMVPGLHIAKSSPLYNPIYTIRGVYSAYNPQVLLLINGVQITNLLFGDRGQLWGGLPVENIARIEVIRGPGSAVYGADAFSGIINIITKTPKDIGGTRVGFNIGSYNTYNSWILHNTHLGNFDTALSLEVSTTDGHGAVIDYDLQSFFDGLFSTSASQAPGESSLGMNRLDFRIDAENSNLHLRFGYQARTEVGVGVGVASALDNLGENYGQRINFDLTFQNFDNSPDWDMKILFSVFDVTIESDLYVFPKGAVMPIGSDGNIGTPGGGFVLFPDGVLGNPYVYEQHYRLGLDTFYTGFTDHNLRIGIGSSYDELEVHETKNFGPSILNGTEGVVDGRLTSVTGTPYVFNKGGNRQLNYIFIQDAWRFSNDWELTTGLRYDDYSDFGSTVNPRLALVWSTSHNLTTKLLYGEAFRAPAFAETRNQNNPVVLGNPDIDPEKMSTVEVAFDYRASESLKLAVNLFSYSWEDIILFIPNGTTGNVANNAGRQAGNGLEFEATWDILPTLRLVSNYAFQKSIDEDINQNSGNAPMHQVYGRFEWKTSEAWQINTQINSVMNRKRPASDARPELDDYTLLDLIVRYTPASSNWSFAFVTRNIFDEHAVEPGPTALPNDLPLAGRNYSSEIRYKF